MSKASLLAWARGWCPDLRVAYALGDDGKVACGARFTLGGEAVEVARQDDPEGQKVAEAVVEEIRARLSVVPMFRDASSSRRELERRVMAARVSGDDAEADRLTQELLEARSGRAGALDARARFGRRPT